MGVQMIKTGQPLTEQQIAGIERDWGTALPASYRNFLKTYNGGKPRPNNFKVPGWRYPASLVNEFKGVSSDPSHFDLLKLNEVLEDRLPKGFVAIGTDPGGNQILLSLKGETRGKIYFFDHEAGPEEDTEDLKDYPNIYFLANDFDEFLNNLKNEDEI